MHIAVIGSGKIGATAARPFVDAGHDVTLASSRGPETLTDIVEELGERMNYYPERGGHVRELDEDVTTSTESLAAHVPDARVVKAFNTMTWTDLRERGSQSLIEEIGFAPLDTGSLAEGGRREQPGSPVYVKKLRRAEARDRLGATR
jgi:8-hydroxy-5-deazaflavin:NADPH oxidoreductase